MDSNTVLKTRFLAFDIMYSHNVREQSFADWPFKEDCNCTPEKMARAGFVHCPSVNEPDVACCFFCLIELEGWEPDDDPWAEHIKRSPKCGFLNMKSDFTDLTVAEYFDMEKERLKAYQKKVCHKKLAQMKEDFDQMLRNIKSKLNRVR